MDFQPETIWESLCAEGLAVKAIRFPSRLCSASKVNAMCRGTRYFPCENEDALRRKVPDMRERMCGNIIDRKLRYLPGLLMLEGVDFC